MAVRDLDPHVDRIVVAGLGTRKRLRQNKSDRQDAHALAEQLRLGGIDTPAFKGFGEFEKLRELVRVYVKVVQDVARTKNRLKMVFRLEASRVKGRPVVPSDAGVVAAAVRSLPGAFQTMRPIACGGGIESFDALCQAEADGAELDGRTFISLTAPSRGRSVLSRLSTDDGPWYRRDGVKVAHDIRTIASDALITPVNLDAQGDNYQHRRILAGTIGTRNDALSCGDWTSCLSQTRIGKSGSSTRFFVGEFVPCSSSAHLLCFEVERR